jgi:hypothetical protein
MRRKSLLLFPCLALAGCATGPSLQSQMAAYIGSDSQTVVQKLGVPDKHITVNDVQYLAYENVTDTDYGFDGYYGYYPYGGMGYYDGGYPYVYSCETTFTLRNDRVLSVTLRGYCD